MSEFVCPFRPLFTLFTLKATNHQRLLLESSSPSLMYPCRFVSVLFVPNSIFRELLKKNYFF